MRNDRYSHRKDDIFGGVDWWTVLIYIALVLMGWISIYAAVYNESHASIFDISQKYGSQVIWIGFCAIIAITILLVDAKYYHYWAYPLYVAMIIVLLAVFVFGKEVNGAKSWFEFGSIRIQPVEFAKFTTALALAKYMSSYNFSLGRLNSISGVGVIIGLPAVIVLAQNDTGSALVFSSFLFVLYREGFNKWVYIVLGLVVFLFVFSYILEMEVLIAIIFLASVIGEGLTNGRWDLKLRYVALVIFCSLLAYLLAKPITGAEIEGWVAFVMGVSVSLVAVIFYAIKYQIRNVALFACMFFGSLLFIKSIDYVFNNIMQVHQQKRILDLLGLESDIRGWGYNVNQSKIAIGSGGFSGKGFLQGTQTKFDFVPEQSTDFIYCTIGEEWGFLGSSLVLILFIVLIYRLMKMGDKQHEVFGRVYCYSVAGIFLFHVLINIGMTIGLLPVIGIPLPFFSYGGSSLLSFTILLFVALRLNSAKEEQSYF